MLMIQKNILMILPIMFGILLIPNIGISFADHDHDDSGGGGCGGDCVPPTLGIGSEGNLLIENGFTLNGKSYQVELSEQTVPTQFIRANEPVEITLRVYENSGPKSLEHVGIVLGNEYVFETSVWMQLPNVEISWDQTFDGIQTVEIENNDYLVTDVDVKTQVDGDVTILKFQFTPTEAFDTSHIMVKMWDQNRSYWVNNFHDGLEIKPNPLSQKTNLMTTEFGGTLPNEDSVETHEDETHQDEIHDDEHDSHDVISADDLNCDENSKAILDSRFGNSFCAPINIATALIEAELATLI